MTRRSIYFLPIIFLGTTTAALAHSCDKCKNGKSAPSPWDGSNINIGYIRNSGNTSNTTLNLAANAIYAKKWWQNTFLGEFQYGKSNGKSTRHYFHFNDQLQFYLDPKVKNDNFIFVNNDTQLTRFGPYSYIMVNAAGYGRKLVDKKMFIWTAQMGPGYRRNKSNTYPYRITSTVLLTTQTNVTLKLGKWGTFTQSARFDWAKPYNYLTTVSALTNKIWNHVAVQISFTTQYYSRIPADSTNTKKLDTTTNISLVYNY